MNNRDSGSINHEEDGNSSRRDPSQKLALKSRTLAPNQVSKSVKTTKKIIDKKNKKRSKSTSKSFLGMVKRFVCLPCTSKPKILVNNGVYDTKTKKTKKKKESNKEKKTLVLDLDGTLLKVSMIPLNSQSKKKVKDKFTFSLGLRLKGRKYVMGVKLRPFFKEFIENVSEYYNLVLWSEMKKEVAIKIMNLIDKNEYFERRFYKENCHKSGFGMRKPLSKLPNYEPSQTIIIDDNYLNISEQDIHNALIIRSYYGEDNDKELIHYYKFLRYISKKPNIRPIKYWKYRYDFPKSHVDKKSIDSQMLSNSYNYYSNFRNKPRILKNQNYYATGNNSVANDHVIHSPDKIGVRSDIDFNVPPSFLGYVQSNNSKKFQINFGVNRGILFGGSSRDEDEPYKDATPVHGKRRSSIKSPFLHPGYGTQHKKNKSATSKLGNSKRGSEVGGLSSSGMGGTWKPKKSTSVSKMFGAPEKQNNFLEVVNQRKVRFRQAEELELDKSININDISASHYSEYSLSKEKSFEIHLQKSVRNEPESEDRKPPVLLQSPGMVSESINLEQNGPGEDGSGQSQEITPRSSSGMKINTDEIEAERKSTKTYHYDMDIVEAAGKLELTSSTDDKNCQNLSDKVHKEGISSHNIGNFVNAHRMDARLNVFFKKKRGPRGSGSGFGGGRFDEVSQGPERDRAHKLKKETSLKKYDKKRSKFGPYIKGSTQISSKEDGVRCRSDGSEQGAGSGGSGPSKFKHVEGERKVGSKT